MKRPMDQLTAHLDRGWDLAQRGDSIGAEASARRAIELSRDSPEAHNLLGFSRAMRGEHEEALELYQQAIALDDTFLEALLNAAELCIHSLADEEAALHFLKDAAHLVETDEELIDVLLLQFDALFNLGREEQAQAVCDRLPKPPYSNPGHAFLVGRAYFETGRFDEAHDLLLEAIQREPDNPEPHYFLAMLCDHRGEARAATDAFLAGRELDLKSPRVPWTLSREAFRLVVESAISHLAPRLSALINPEEIYLSQMPGVEVVTEGVDPRALVLLDSIEGENHPLRVFVYQDNVERAAGGAERVEDVLRSALEQEIAHVAFGDQDHSGSDKRALN